MATLVGTSSDITKVIHDLMHLEYDAMAAYEQTISRLDNSTYKAKVSEFLSDHKRHLSELKSIAQGLNIEIPDGTDMKAVLTQGKVVLADPFGDASILKAMKTNEDDTVTAYERACKFDNAPQNFTDCVTRALSDEQRHRAWFQQTAESESNSKAA